MDANSKILLRTMLVRQEGLRLLPYTDITGHITIGVGRNLSEKGISSEEAFMLLDNDVDYFLNKLSESLPWYLQLDETRQMAIVSMAFNLGIKGILEFKSMLSALENKNWQAAHDYCLDSLAAKQAPCRYNEIANILLNGEITNG